MRTSLAGAIGVLAATVVAACSLQVVNPPNELSEAGAKVRVADQPSEVLNCRSLGMIRARTASIFGKVDAVADQQADARNKAATIGGDTVVVRNETLPVVDPGSQAYEVFLCASR